MLEELLAAHGFVIARAHGKPGRNLIWEIWEKSPIHPAWQFERTTINMVFLADSERNGLPKISPKEAKEIAQERVPLLFLIEVGQLGLELPAPVAKITPSKLSYFFKPAGGEEPQALKPHLVRTSKPFLLEGAIYRLLLYRRFSDFASFKKRHAKLLHLPAMALRILKEISEFSPRIKLRGRSLKEKARALQVSP